MDRNPIRPQPRAMSRPQGEVIPPEVSDEEVFKDLMSRPRKGGPGSGYGWRKADIDPQKLYEIARLGCTQTEAAQFFGVAETTFELRLKKDEESRRMWDLGHSQAKMSLRRLQMLHARTPGAPGVSMTIHLSKFWLNEREDSVKVTGGDGGPIKMSFAFDTPASRAALSETANEDE